MNSSDISLADAIAGIISTFGRSNSRERCKLILNGQLDRVEYFKERMDATDRDPREWAILLCHVDDKHGREIAEALMPGYDWNPIRATGAMPIARGFVNRVWIHGLLETFDPSAAKALEGVYGKAVIVIAHGVAEVYPA